MRMLSYPSLTADGGITFTGYDEFYHMRRILYTVFNFPHILNFDTYINYPYGFEVGWPPFFDLLGSLLALILGAGQPDTHTVEFAGALLPVLLGVLTIVPIYVVATLIFDKRTGLVGALAFAVLPAHVYVSRFGTVDHHVAEVFLSTVAYAFFILALKLAGESKLSLSSLKNISSDKKIINPLVFSVVSGLFFSLVIFTWIGAPAFISFIVLYALIQTTLDLKAGKESDYVFICSAATLFATLLFTIPLVAGTVRQGFEMSAMYLSWFQVVYVLGMLAGVFLLWGFSAYISKKEMDWKYYPGILILVLGSSLLLLRVFSTEFYVFIIEGMRFFSGKGEYISTIAEAVPLFLTGQGQLTLSSVLGSFGLSFLAALAGFFLLILESKNEKSKPERVFFLVWTLFYAYLALSQRRFTYLFAVNVSILTAYLLLVLLDSFDFEKEIKKLVNSEKRNEKNSIPVPQTRKKTSLKTRSKSKTRQEAESKNKAADQPDYFKLVSGVALIGLIFVPSIWLCATFAKDAVSIGPEWKDSLEWLQTSTPETSYYLEPSETPEYGVLSWWDYGNWIVYVGKRPAVSNNFQTGVEDSANFFLTDSEEEAKAIVEKLNVKYIITDTLMAEGKFSAIAEIAGKDVGDYYDVKTTQGNTGLKTVATPKQALLQTQIYKLQKLDGTSLGNFRLVHESSNTTESEESKENTVKVFKYVKGATLSGIVSPDETVMATLELTSNTGRKFTYQKGDVADEKGSFEIDVAYPTESTGNGVHATSAYSLTAGENSTITGVQVTEGDILNGNRIEVNIPD
jgi:oligosaccharyl transferase (archaeosortase A-associated)